MTRYLVSAIVFSVLTAAVALAETSQGPCTLVYDQRGRVVSHQLELGSVIKGRCELKLMEFVGATAITANGVFMNTGDTAMKFAYYVSLLDEEGKLVGSTGATYWDKATAVGPGKSARPASCIIRIPDSARDKVVSYQVVFYEEELAVPSKDQDVEPATEGDSEDRPREQAR